MNVMQPRLYSFITRPMNKISRRVVAFWIVSSRDGTLSVVSGDHNLGLVIVFALWRNSHCVGPCWPVLSVEIIAEEGFC